MAKKRLFLIFENNFDTFQSSLKFEGEKQFRKIMLSLFQISLYDAA